jgi:hypothetical protein
MNKAYEVTKAYFFHTGLHKVAHEAVIDFIRSSPQLDGIAASELAGVLETHLPAVLNEVNPVVNMDKVYANISPVSMELRNFKAGFVPGPRVDEALALVAEYPFGRNAKRTLTAALKVTYAQDTLLPDLPNLPETAAMPVENVPTATPTTDTSLEKDVIQTINDYLVNSVFQSKIIPQINIIGTNKVSSGTVLDLEFTSVDNVTKAFASTVVFEFGGKPKMALPAVLYNDAGEEIGLFNKETFESIFSAAQPIDNVSMQGQQQMLDELLETETPVQANAILQKAIKRFGSDTARHLFEVYAMAKHNYGNPSAKVPGFTKLQVKEEQNNA